MTSFIRALFLLISLGASLSAFGQTASLLPNAKQTFLNSNGTPLASGTVTFYVPNTSTLKTTWQNAGETIANTNPVVLDSAGRAIIYGDGSYRQVVKDKLGNTIWDQVTSSTGSGGGPVVSTGDGDLVGTIKPWAGLVAPNQYAFAYGQEISRVTYTTLFTAITLSVNVTCTASSSVLTNLADTTQIPTGANIETTCVAPGTTVVSKTSTTITVSNNASITTTASSVIFPWGNGNGSTTFNLPDFRGRVIAGRDNMGGTAASRLTSTYYGETASAIGANGGLQSQTLVSSNLPAYTPTGTVAITDPGHTHITAIATGAATGGTIGTPTNIVSSTTTDFTSQKSSTGVTAAFSGVAQGGTSAAFSIIQPTMTANYIIKITPDTNSASATGVLSIGGMTGVIACGDGLLCTGNIISAPSSSWFLSTLPIQSPIYFLGATNTSSGIPDTAGSGYTDGFYAAVPLIGGTGSGATADITVAGGVVTLVTLQQPASGYSFGDIVSASPSTIGGTGSGFTITAGAGNRYVPTSGIVEPAFAVKIGTHCTSDTSNPYGGPGWVDTPSIGPFPSTGLLFFCADLADNTPGNYSGIFSTVFNSDNRYAAGVTGIGVATGINGNVWGGQFQALCKNFGAICQGANIEADIGIPSAGTANTIAVNLVMGSASAYCNSNDCIGNSFIVFTTTGAHTPSSNLISMNGDSSRPLVNTGGTIFGGNPGNKVISYGIDFNNATFGLCAFRSSGICIDGNGRTNLLNGTAALPAYTFGTETSSGMWLAAAMDHLGISHLGKNVLSFRTPSTGGNFLVLTNGVSGQNPQFTCATDIADSCGVSIQAHGSTKWHAIHAADNNLVGGWIRIYAANDLGAVGLKGPSTTTGNALFDFTLPIALPVGNGYPMLSDTSGQLSVTQLNLTTAVTGILPENNGGTNQSTYTLGDILYSSAANVLSKLAGNTTSTKKVLTQTGTGAVSAAPSWAQLSCSDLSGVGTGCSSSAGITALTGDVTASGSGSVVATLATVNSNVGTFGSATQSVQFTVNGKGLLTAAANVTVTPAVGSITGLGTGVATALGVNIGSAGAFITFNGAGGTPSSLTLTNGTGLPVGSITGFGTGVATALAVNIGTAGSPVVNGGALGSPSSAGTLPAHTLGGTVSGGGNQINNVIIGTSTPLAGAFTAVTATTVSASTWISAGATDGYRLGSAQIISGNSTYTTLYDPDGGQGVTFGGVSDPSDYFSNTNIVARSRNFGTTFTTTTAGGFVINTGQLNVTSMTQTAVAQSGTVCYNSGTGAITYDASVGCLASIRSVKDIIGALSPVNALNMVLRLEPISFRFHQGIGDDGQYEQFGLIAEDVAAIDERLIGRDNDGNLRGVRYTEMTAVLAAAMQALKADNDNLRARLERLEK